MRKIDEYVRAVVFCNVLQTSRNAFNTVKPLCYHVNFYSENFCARRRRHCVVNVMYGGQAQLYFVKLVRKV